MIETRQLYDGFYVLEGPAVRQFLILGEDRALLIDTGFGDGSVATAVRALTPLPVEVLLTHGDPDHTGGVADFGHCRLYPADWAMLPEGIDVQPLSEGEVIRCGGYALEVIAVPGHTPGSVAFYDRGHELLLSGDSVQKEGPIYMFGPHRDIARYIASLDKLDALIPPETTVLPCHSSCPIDASYIARNLSDALALRDDRLPRRPHPELPCDIRHGQWTAFLSDPA